GARGARLRNSGGNGEEERWRCSLYRGFVPQRRCYRQAEERRHARKSGPSRVIAAGSPGSGRLPRPDETGLPREAMPLLAGRMAKQGEEKSTMTTKTIGVRQKGDKRGAL